MGVYPQFHCRNKVAPKTPNTRGGTWLIKWLNDQFPSLVAIIYIQWIGAIMKLPLEKNPQRDFGIPFKAIWGKVVLTGPGFTTNSSKESSWNERPTKTVRTTILRI